jgi:hypothetical protein
MVGFGFLFFSKSMKLTEIIKHDLQTHQAVTSRDALEKTADAKKIIGKKSSGMASEPGQLGK